MGWIQAVKLAETGGLIPGYPAGFTGV